MTDTSTEEAENLAKWHADDAEHYAKQDAPHIASAARETAALLRALAAERDALQEALEKINNNAKREDATPATLLLGCGVIARAALKGKGNE